MNDEFVLVPYLCIVMKYIGLENFRKFKHMLPLQLGNINILVGENNSGKSTFTKAALLLANFLNIEDGVIDKMDPEDPQFRTFSFREDQFKNVYIDTFYQALCSRSDNGVIKFHCELKHFDISISVVEPTVFHETPQYRQFFKENSGPFYDYEEWSSIFPKIRENDPHVYKKELSKAEASVSRIEIVDRANGVFYVLDYENAGVHCKFFDVSLGEALDALDLELTKVGRDSDEFYELTKKRHEIFEGIKDLSTGYYDNFGSDYCIEILINSAKDSMSESDLERIEDSYAGLRQVLSGFRVEYIYAHSVHQLSSYRFDPSFSNDYVDQTISRYRIAQKEYAKGLTSGVIEPYSFVKEWIRRFGIGDDFVMWGGDNKTEEGRAVHVKIMDGDEEQDLSSKGIGAIQLFILILRIATIVSAKPGRKTIVIEEPEQNLHPALQSRLADFFKEVSDVCNCQFIIETHSEYLVRRTQLIVSELKNFSENPFRVFYFPHIGAPYNMRFSNSGRFIDHFGEGFFDEAGRMHLQLLNNEQGR